MHGRFAIKVILSVTVAAIIGGYAYYQTKNLAAGPQIEISAPRNGTGTDNKLLIIEGTAKNISKINLNDFPIYINQEGGFKEKILISEGYNVIEISAADRFGRTTEKILEIVYTGK